MPVSGYYAGKGEKVMASMQRKYGAKKGKKIFYATASRHGKRPHNRQVDGVFDEKDLKVGYRNVGPA